MEIQLSPIEITQLVNQIILISASGRGSAGSGKIYVRITIIIVISILNCCPFEQASGHTTPWNPRRPRLGQGSDLMPTPDVILRLYPSTPVASPFFSHIRRGSVKCDRFPGCRTWPAPPYGQREKTVAGVIGAGAGTLCINSEVFSSVIRALHLFPAAEAHPADSDFGVSPSLFSTLFLRFFSSFANFRSLVEAKQIDITAQAASAA